MCVFGKTLLQAHFGIDEYSDVTMLSKPTIYVSQHDIHYTHKLLIENLQQVAPEADDDLREVRPPSPLRDEMLFARVCVFGRRLYLLAQRRWVSSPSGTGQGVGCRDRAQE